MSATAGEHRYAVARAEGRLAVGVFCVLDGAAASHLLASAGFDVVVLDRQHAAVDVATLETLAHRVRSTGATVLVRTAGVDAAELDLTLDLPVHGVVLPDLRDAEEVEAAVARTRYPPRGIRSIGNERTHAVLGTSHDPDADPVVVLLIENRDAVEDVEAMCAVDGVDAVWVGTHDLAADLGLDPEAAVREPPAELRDASERVRAAAVAHGVDFWTTRGAVLADAAGEVERGAAAVVWGVDARLLQGAARDALAAFRQATS